MSWLYRIGINHRNRAFDAGKEVTRFDRAVISIGNLSTGGTGKTPMVQLVVSMLQQLGQQPVIAMRGYGARPGEKGDEQLEHEEALPGVQIVAQPDRIGGLRLLFDTDLGKGIDCVVLDDGFQHRKIARDLDIVLIDASRPPDRDALLPKGHLRESIQSLSRAGLVVLTHCERVSNDEIERQYSLIVEQNTQVPVLTAHHKWVSFIQYTRTQSGWSEQPIPCEDLLGVELQVVCGIGNSDAYCAMIREHGLLTKNITNLRDHAELGESEIRRLTIAEKNDEISPVFMTRKDWVKTSKNSNWPIGTRVILPQLSMDLGDQKNVLLQLIKGMFNRD